MVTRMVLLSDEQYNGLKRASNLAKQFTDNMSCSTPTTFVPEVCPKAISTDFQSSIESAYQQTSSNNSKLIPDTPDSRYLENFATSSSYAYKSGSARPDSAHRAKSMCQAENEAGTEKQEKLNETE